MSCGAGCRHGWDPALLWLWHRPVATAPIGPLAWEPPHAAEGAQEMAKKDKKKKKKYSYLLYIFIRLRIKCSNNLVPYKTQGTAGVLSSFLEVFSGNL